MVEESVTGPDYSMYTMRTCTGGSTTSETLPQGKRENCHWAKMYWNNDD